MITDPISDLLTRIRNASKAREDKVEIPASRLKANIVKVLRDEGFIRSFRLVRENERALIAISLKYEKSGEPVIRGIRRISRPGLRKYIGYEKLGRSRGGAGVAILSTSQGVITGQKARTSRCGGEILCEVW